MQTNNTIEGKTEDVHHGVVPNTKDCDKAGALESGAQVEVSNLETVVAKKVENIIEKRKVVTK